MEPLDYVGVIVLAILMSLAIAAGLGGGEIIVPVMKILFLFVQAEASTLSQCCIMAAGFTRFTVNYRKKHPYRDAVPIEYGVAMLLMPAIFFGISIGVMLHKVVPGVIQELLLVGILLYCEYEAIKKGISNWKMESREKQQALEKNQCILDKNDEYDPDNSNNDSNKGSESLLSKDPSSNQKHRSDEKHFKPSLAYTDTSGLTSNNTPNSIRKNNTELIEQRMKKDRSHWQLDKLIPIWIMFVALIVQSVVKDSDVAGVKKCSAEYWLIYAAYVVICICGVVYSVYALKKDTEYRERIGCPDFRGNVKFTTKKIIVVSCVCMTAGMMASLVGVGGSMIYIPMLLILGFPPFVASSTNIFLVMYSATANSISYVISGQINVYDGLWYGLWTAIGVVIGVTGANRIVEKTGRQSIFLIVLAGVLVISISFSIIFNTLDIIDEVNGGKHILEIGNL